MIHHNVSAKGDHYAVAPNADRTRVLVQIEDRGTQVRLPLKPEEAEHMIQLIESALEKIRLEGS